MRYSGNIAQMTMNVNQNNSLDMSGVVCACDACGWVYK